MKLKRFDTLNESSWQEKAYNRKNEYFELLENVLDAYKIESSYWKEDTKWHYTSEMYDLLKSLIENLARLNEDLSDNLSEKLEEINNKR